MSDELQFTINLRPEPEGGFTVLVPALPEVVTYGADEAEALRMAQDAIELALTVRRDQGDEIPADVRPLTRTLTVRSAA
ncbi:MAG TPA: type II toxin-antitoxin system HicB family antitoxin [Bauldia sp.]|nr:type II toxin-antitoxin system HicB family antitoxin [Bauldia sp.]